MGANQRLSPFGVCPKFGQHGLIQVLIRFDFFILRDESTRIFTHALTLYNIKCSVQNRQDREKSKRNACIVAHWLFCCPTEYHRCISFMFKWKNRKKQQHFFQSFDWETDRFYFWKTCLNFKQSSSELDFKLCYSVYVCVCVLKCWIDWAIVYAL